MSKKIPFLQMFAMLSVWPELAAAAESWLIVSAAIDKASRSAKVVVAGASGAGANLIAQVEEAAARAYGLASVKLDCPAPAPAASVQTGPEPREPAPPAKPGPERQEADPGRKEKRSRRRPS